MFYKFLFIILLSIFLFAQEQKENINKDNSTILEEKISSVTNRIDILEKYYEKKILDIEKARENDIKNYENLLQNNSNIFSSSLAYIQFLLTIISVVFVILGWIGYKEIKEFISKKINENIDEKAQASIKELKTLLEQANKNIKEIDTIKNQYDEQLKELTKISIETSKIEESIIPITKDSENKTNKTEDNWFSLGLEYYKKGNLKKAKEYYDKAKEYYEKALKINPNNDIALYHLGFYYQINKDFEKAKEYYEKALKINPNSVNGLNILGLYYEIINDNEKAKECYEKALKINPNNYKTSDNLNNLSKKL